MNSPADFACARDFGRWTSRVSSIVVAVVLALVSCSRSVGPLPWVSETIVITSASPTSVEACGVLEIRGRGFRSTSTMPRVLIGVDTLVIDMRTDSLIKARVRLGMTSGLLRIIAGADTVAGPVIDIVPPAWWFKGINVYMGLQVWDSTRSTSIDADTSYGIVGYGHEIREETDAAWLLSSSCASRSLRWSRLLGQISMDVVADVRFTTQPGMLESLVLRRGRHDTTDVGSYHDTEQAELALAGVPFVRTTDDGLVVDLRGKRFIEALRAFKYRRIVNNRWGSTYVHWTVAVDTTDANAYLRVELGR